MPTFVRIHLISVLAFVAEVGLAAGHAADRLLENYRKG